MGLTGCGNGTREAPDDPPDNQLGERLFRETRFAQFFFAQSGGDVNAVLAQGDPVLATLATTSGTLPGPFVGQSINCRQCHLVDDAAAGNPLLVRTYGDFARRSPLPGRSDGLTETPRNSPPLVGATLPRDSEPFLLHFDGEFASSKDLIIGTLTGRNFGWLPSETATATHHVAQIIREDNGTGALAQSYSALSYAVQFRGTSRSIPDELVLPVDKRFEVSGASDDDIVNAVATMIAAYLDGLRFQAGPDGAHTGSPYDRFLAKNGLPAQPDSGESAFAYLKRLRAAVSALRDPVWVSDPQDGIFNHHDQTFAFGQAELNGLKIFLAQPADPTQGPTGAEIASGGLGNCAACHVPPEFTDFRFHNTGVSQEEFDAVWGGGAFTALSVPSLAGRTAADLPPSAQDPASQGPFRSPADKSHPGFTDLGLWNVFANTALPTPQPGLPQAIRESSPAAAQCSSGNSACLLPFAIALFKNPGLRDLGQSEPYFHNGAASTIEAAIQHYVTFAPLARAGSVRNGAPEMKNVALISSDVAPLAAFLRALNEDYE